MKIIMPLFDFVNTDSKEFVFGDGTYSLRQFDPEGDIPKRLPGLSEMDLTWLKEEGWALVAETDDPRAHREEVNLLLLSFKIHTLARPFIKYRLCPQDVSFCAKVEETMTFVSPEKSPRTVTADELEAVNIGFQGLLEMYRLQGASSRAHNALYFLYLAYFVAGIHWVVVFTFLACVLEALFSKDAPGGATETICKRASSFLQSQPRCTYADIERLYNIRSEIVHGRRTMRPETSGQNIADTHELEFVVTQCMKKLLSERLYLLYSDKEGLDKYFENLVTLRSG